jgi:hypothetical protein
MHCSDHIEGDGMGGTCSTHGRDDKSGSGLGLVAGSCEHCNEPSSSIKGEEFLD